VGEQGILMDSNSATFVLRLHGNCKWLWLLLSAGAIVALLHSFIVLQLLSAILLFAAFYVICAAVVGAFFVLLAALDRLFQWIVVAFVFIGRSLKSSFLQIEMMAARGSVISHVHAGGRRRN
jgi:hypothetical protein